MSWICVAASNGVLTPRVVELVAELDEDDDVEVDDDDVIMSLYIFNIYTHTRFVCLFVFAKNNFDNLQMQHLRQSARQK